MIYILQTISVFYQNFALAILQWQKNGEWRSKDQFINKYFNQYNVSTNSIDENKSYPFSIRRGCIFARLQYSNKIAFWLNDNSKIFYGDPILKIMAQLLFVVELVENI